jgi:outer membrane protein assembly factor BamB
VARRAGYRRPVASPRAVIVGVGAVLATLGLLSEPVPSARAGLSTAYQVTPAHTGFQDDARPNPPLRRAWSRDFGARRVSYGLVARGRVFVTVGNVPGSLPYGTTLYALSRRSGRILWERPLGGTYYRGAAAYDRGRVFAANYDGVLRSFSARSGRLLWERQLPGQYAFSSPPVASRGTVWVGGAGSGGTLYAVSERTGALRWTRPVENGSQSSPALSRRSVFVSYACPHVYSFSRRTGRSLWHYAPGCTGGGGRTPVHYRRRLYVREPFGEQPFVFDALRGRVLGRFDAGPAPAFARGLAFVLDSNGFFRALRVRGMRTQWTFARQGLQTAPLAVGQYVYLGASTGHLYALHTRSGRLVWARKVAPSIHAPDEHNVSAPLTGFTAGEGVLLVPAGGRLLAYR